MKTVMACVALALAGCAPARPDFAASNERLAVIHRRQSEATADWQRQQFERLRARVPGIVDLCAAQVPAAGFRGRDAAERREAAIRACVEREVDTAADRIAAEMNRRLASDRRMAEQDMQAMRSIEMDYDRQMQRANDRVFAPGSPLNPVQVQIVR